jgi:hypothetical protein
VEASLIKLEKTTRNRPAIVIDGEKLQSADVYPGAKGGWIAFIHKYLEAKKLLPKDEPKS